MNKMSYPEQIAFELHDGPPIAWKGILEMMNSNGYKLWKVTNPRFTGSGCGPSCRFPRLSASLRPLAELYFIHT